MDQKNEIVDDVLEEIKKLVITKSMENESFDIPCENAGMCDNEPVAVEKVVWHIKDDDDNNDDDDDNDDEDENTVSSNNGQEDKQGTGNDGCSSSDDTTPNHEDS